MDEKRQQLMMWFEELQDLRRIVAEELPEKEDGFANIEEAIQHFHEEYEATGETGFEQIIFWLERIKEARERIKKDVKP